MKKDEIIITSVIAAIGAVFAIISIVVESTVAKLIFGILAFAFIGLAICIIVEEIIIHKRKRNNLVNVFKNAFEEQAKNPEFQEIFAKGMEESAKKRDILFDSQRPDDDDYGYSLSNPIMTSTISRSDVYLNNLRTSDGQKFTWVRTKSYCMKEIGGIENVMVDEYQLFLNDAKYKVIYICPYGHTSSYAPKGMILAE